MFGDATILKPAGMAFSSSRSLAAFGVLLVPEARHDDHIHPRRRRLRLRLLMRSHSYDG